MPREVLYVNLTWPELKERVKECDIAILPVGSIEQHGLHMPLGTDTFFIYEVVKRAAEKVSDEVGALVLPPVYYGTSVETRDFAGTIDISPATFSSLVGEIVKNLVRHGFRKIVVVNGHGGNELKTPLRALWHEGVRALLVVVGPWSLVSDLIRKVKETEVIGHACEVETSMNLYLFPHMIRRDRIQVGEMPPESRLPYSYIREGKGVNVLETWSTLERGALGDATKASYEKGRILVEAWVDRFAEFLRELKAASPGREYLGPSER